MINALVPCKTIYSIGYTLYSALPCTDCLTLFTSEAEQYACHVGCNKLPPLQQNTKVQTVSAVAVVRETHIGIRVKESLKRLENNDETFNKNIEVNIMCTH